MAPCSRPSLQGSRGLARRGRKRGLGRGDNVGDSAAVAVEADNCCSDDVGGAIAVGSCIDGSAAANAAIQVGADESVEGGGGGRATGVDITEPGCAGDHEHGRLVHHSVSIARHTCRRNKKRRLLSAAMASNQTSFVTPPSPLVTASPPRPPKFVLVGNSASSIVPVTSPPTVAAAIGGRSDADKRGVRSLAKCRASDKVAGSPVVTDEPDPKPVVPENFSKAIAGLAGAAASRWLCPSSPAQIYFPPRESPSDSSEQSPPPPTSKPRSVAVSETTAAPLKETVERRLTACLQEQEVLPSGCAENVTSRGFPAQNTKGRPNAAAHRRDGKSNKVATRRHRQNAGSRSCGSMRASHSGDAVAGCIDNSKGVQLASVVMATPPVTLPPQPLEVAPMQVPPKMQAPTLPTDSRSAMSPPPPHPPLRELAPPSVSTSVKTLTQAATATTASTHSSQSRIAAQGASSVEFGLARSIDARRCKLRVDRRGGGRGRGTGVGKRLRSSAHGLAARVPLALQALCWVTHRAAVKEYMSDITRRLRHNEERQQWRLRQQQQRQRRRQRRRQQRQLQFGRQQHQQQSGGSDEDDDVVSIAGVEEMRAATACMLVEVQCAFGLGTTVLFLAIDLLDRIILSVPAVAVWRGRHWRLVGATALWIAAKFESERSFCLDDVLRLASARHGGEAAYGRDDVRRVEAFILTVVEFRVMRTTSVHFLRWFQVTHGCSVAVRDLSQYLLELAIVDGKMLGTCLPSHLAASAVVLSNKLLTQKRWSASCSAGAAKHAEQLLEPCAKGLCSLLDATRRSDLMSVRAKFAASSFHAALAPTSSSGVASGSV
eukprot:TRINITY_DN61563_c0_g1_i1.p1 TRINITY_DN61563_c0_g1~~TRINITY_DN61563_c0_g1_i1.p1  ORF type:complete len:829 (-),score=125.14 TRINITY_DN61563_c0_g1_i1:43-2529(-)